MSITDELREFADEFERVEWNGLAERAREIADRIDEQHRKALEKVAAMVDEDAARGEYTRGYNGGYDAATDMLDALERRIDRLDGTLDGMGKGAASRIEAIEGRVGAIERKLNHRGER